MTGVKGRSGGARPGAGRKPAKPVHSRAKALRTADPEAWLTALMVDEDADLKVRKDAAKALLVHKAKMADQVGKKEAQRTAAGKVGGRFAATAPPKLALVK